MDITSIRRPGGEGPPMERECFTCYEGVVYLGYLLEDEHDEEIEMVEAVPCRRCRRSSAGENL